jgi:hypothetical protein
MIWMYLDGNDEPTVATHALKNKLELKAACGKIPSWYGAVWKYDKDGIAARQQCKNCLKMIELRRKKGLLARPV